jgi:hypothetical protein
MESQKIRSPKTGRPITVGKGEYNKLLASGYTVDDLNKFIITQEKIKSPKTGKMITIGGVAYNKLINEGYINTTNIETTLPEEAMVNLILTTYPYDLIELYKTNKSYHRLLNSQYVLNSLYDKHDIYKPNILSFQNFIYQYMEKEMSSLYFKKPLYIENQIYTSFTIISDYWKNYKIKIYEFEKYHLGGKFHIAWQYLDRHGYGEEIENAFMNKPSYQEWLDNLKIKIYQYILSKKGHYKLAPKKEIKLNI